METRVQRWASVDDFLSVSRDFLVAREAEHCLLLGLAATMASHPEIYPGPRFWTVHDGDRVVAAALRTPPYNLQLSQVDEPRWVAVLAADVLASDEPPGVMGAPAAARMLADAWSARTGRTAECVVQERVYRLDRVTPPRPAPGRCREAEERDRSLLTAWTAAFTAEALPGPLCQRD
jgi:hypothetical protein